MNGNKDDLQKILNDNPDFIKQQSNYGHRATSLHYRASNGVELWRQQVPNNLLNIAKVLIKYGADVSATMNVYNGQFTTYELYKSSTHPCDAGINGNEIMGLLSLN